MSSGQAFAPPRRVTMYAAPQRGVVIVPHLVAMGNRPPHDKSLHAIRTSRHSSSIEGGTAGSPHLSCGLTDRTSWARGGLFFRVQCGDTERQSPGEEPEIMKGPSYHAIVNRARNRQRSLTPSASPIWSIELPDWLSIPRSSRHPTVIPGFPHCIHAIRVTRWLQRNRFFNSGTARCRSCRAGSPISGHRPYRVEKRRLPA
jgi:hypothetical protein